MKTGSEDVVRGLEFLIQESRRLAENLGEEHWDKTESLDGWKNRQVLAHVAGIATIVAPFAQNLVAAGESANAGEGVNIDVINAGLVAAREGKSPKELADEIATAYAGVIEFVKQQPADLWDQRRTFGGYKDVTLGDIFMRMVVLHGIGHIYASHSTVMNS